LVEFTGFIEKYTKPKDGRKKWESLDVLCATDDVEISTYNLAKYYADILDNEYGYYVDLS